jgi:hypothetical protein
MTANAISSPQPRGRARIDPLHDPEAWVLNNERITNDADLEGWLALYAPDIVFEAITDGASDRIVGLTDVAAAVTALSAICKRHRLKVSKRFVAASGNVVVNTWTGGFAGRDRQSGLEIWTLRGSLVIHHEQYTFLDVRPSTSTVTLLRALFGGELAIKLKLAKSRRATRRGPQEASA